MNIKNQFPIFQEKIKGKELIYLDSAATMQKPQEVIDAITTFYSKQYGTVHRAIYDLSANSTKMYDEAREKIGLFLSTRQKEEIVFTKGTTEAINLVAKTFIQEGDIVLVPEIEHHSNIVPWQLSKASLKTIRTDISGDLDLNHLQELLEKGAKLLTLAHISNTLGTEHPIKQIIELAHQYGTKVLIDAAQSAPHKKLDVQALDCDFLVFSGHKLYGPTGIGILYAKYEILKELPPFLGGGDMIFQVNFEESNFNEPPLRFEAGTPPIVQVIGLGAAVDFINKIGLDYIDQKENKLLDLLLKGLQTFEEVKILGSPKKRGSLLSFNVEGIHAFDIGSLLNLKGIAVRTGHLCSQPTMQKFQIPSVVRASLAAYNEVSDIEFFIDSLRDAIQKLKS